MSFYRLKRIGNGIVHLALTLKPLTSMKPTYFLSQCINASGRAADPFPNRPGLPAEEGRGSA